MRTRRQISAFAGVALVLALAICGTASGAGASGATADRSEKTASRIASRASLPPLTVAVSTFDGTQAEGALAQALGYFKRVGLTVKFVNAASNTLTQVLAGQADIGVQGLPAPILPAAQGKSTTIIAMKSTGGAVDIAGKPGLTSVTECKSISTAAVGTGVYTFAKNIEKYDSIDWNVVALANYNPTAMDMLLSGQVDCTSLPPGNVTPVVEAGKAVLLVEPATGKGMPAEFPKGLIGGVFYGVTDNLEQKRASVIAFLRGVNTAVKYMKAHPAGAGAALHTVSGYDVLSADVLTSQIRSNIRTTWPNHGIIYGGQWNRELPYLASGGTVFDGGTTAPVWSYAQRVDMSYLNAALKPPCKKGQKSTAKKRCSKE